MPWCPVCKNEYKEGYKVCADCDADLVESLEDISNSADVNENEVEIENETEDFSENEFCNSDSEIPNDLSGLSEEQIVELAKKIEERRNYKPFVKSKDRAQEYKSSAYALIIVGVGGLIFLALCLFGVIGLAIGESVKSVAFFVMLFMFLAFIFLGVRSFVAARAIGALVDDEDSLTTNIELYFRSNYTKEKIDELALSEEDIELEEELKYFKRIGVIRDILTKEFGELEESYIDNQVEQIFGFLYDRG